jgi:hypothetical protein
VERRGECVRTRRIRRDAEKGKVKTHLDVSPLLLAHLRIRPHRLLPSNDVGGDVGVLEAVPTGERKGEWPAESIEQRRRTNASATRRQ